MRHLYTTLASVYHEIYQYIFNYDEEFDFYNSILREYNSNKILEIGCGSGMLARRFLKNDYNYTGLDLSDQMLEIARNEVSKGEFVQGDMRTLTFSSQFDGILITGRSFSYIIENRGVMDTFTGIHKALTEGGLFVFDVFEAAGIFEDLKDFDQQFQHNGKQIQRINKLKPNMATGWTWDWEASYIIGSGDKKEALTDLTTLRAFTKDEISLFLKLAKFEVVKIMEESKAMSIVARKM